MTNRIAKIEKIGIVVPMYIVRGYENETVLVYQYSFDTEEEAKEAAKEFTSRS